MSLQEFTVNSKKNIFKDFLITLVDQITYFIIAKFKKGFILLVKWCVSSTLTTRSAKTFRVSNVEPANAWRGWAPLLTLIAYQRLNRDPFSIYHPLFILRGLNKNAGHILDNAFKCIKNSYLVTHWEYKQGSRKA